MEFGTAMVCVGDLSALGAFASDMRLGRDVPCVDGSELARGISRLQAWSVQPCVRPLSAVHMTVGHNALRGSGPGQELAFNDAMAQMGCPDRQIDGSALRAVCPPQPSHHAGSSA